MTIALDAGMLIMLFDEAANAPVDPVTGQPVSHCQMRIRHFLNMFSRPKGARVIIPTPALSEFLVKVQPDKAVEYVNQIQRIRGCQLAPFSVRASIELAEMQRTILNERRRPKRQDVETRAKVKFDQQIVAIARVEGATSIYSDDERLGNFAERFGIERISVSQLPLPPDAMQGLLPLEPPEAGLDRAEEKPDETER